MSKSVMIIGAGVVGLACACSLAQAGFDVVIAEQHHHIATEVSGRNSGVIHAGIYYPHGSMQARLCLRGKELLYRYCAERGVPHKNVQKLIVATTGDQNAVLADLRQTAARNGVALDHISGAEAMAQEPQLFATSALVSPTTGIVDVHALVYALLADAESAGAVLSVDTTITQIDDQGDGMRAFGHSQGAPFDMAFDHIVIAAGLGAPDLAHQIWPDAPRPPQKLAKGNYVAISGAQPFSRLIYPVPEQAGLGIHYTMDMAGQSRLGPNVRWVDDADYDVDDDAETAFRNAVRGYWPGVEDRHLTPDYVGIRPKIAGGDFIIHRHGRAVILLGIESPGLTSSLAIAEDVMGLLVPR